MSFIDYYKILGLSKDATEKEIKAAYRKLARKYHPDLNPGDKEAELKFKQINEANEVLSDPENRKKYDQYGKDWKHAEEFEKARKQQQQQRSPTSSTPISSNRCSAAAGALQGTAEAPGSRGRIITPSSTWTWTTSTPRNNRY